MSKLEIEFTSGCSEYCKIGEILFVLTHITYNNQKYAVLRDCLKEDEDKVKQYINSLIRERELLIRADDPILNNVVVKDDYILIIQD